MIKRSFLAVILLLTMIAFADAQVKPVTKVTGFGKLNYKGNPEITADELRQEIGFLASDSLKGRKPGMPEEIVAAHYIRDMFREAGLQMLGDEGFQKFIVVVDVKPGAKNLMETGGYKAEMGKDFMPLSFSANGSINAPVIFAGYGFDLNQDSLKWSDYAGLDVKGKWAIVLRGDPEPDKANSAFFPFEQERSKVLTAHDKGALGVLLVSPSDIDKSDALMHMQYDKTPADAGIPVINITRAMADRLLSSMNYTMADLESQIKSNHKPGSLLLPVNLNATTDLIPEKVETMNVVGLIKGSDPELNRQYIVVGAHYDHLGFGGQNSGSRVPDTLAIHYGADDNASGTAGVIELAQKLQANAAKLKYSVIMVSFTAEEMGLLGSKEFVKNPPIDLKKVRAMINLDMVGRLNPETKAISVGGTGTSSESDSLVTLLSANRPFEVKHSPDGYGPSDHASFYGENIPVFYFTTGAHEDYHTPTDRAEKIDYNGEVSVLSMVYDLAVQLADRDQPLVFREAGSKQGGRYGRNMKVTLGIVPDMVSVDNKGLRVDGTRKGGPAEKAGIRKGDVIVSMEGQTVTNIYDYMARLTKLKPGQIATVEIMREGKKQVMIVQF